MGSRKPGKVRQDRSDRIAATPQHQKVTPKRIGLRNRHQRHGRKPCGEPPIKRSVEVAVGKGSDSIGQKHRRGVASRMIKALVAQSQKRSAVFDIVTNPTNVTVSVK